MHDRLLVHSGRLFHGPVGLHQFSKDLQHGFLVSAFGNNGFQRLPCVIDGTPKIAPLAVDLYTDLVHMPLPLWVRPRLLNALPADLGRKQQTKLVPQAANRLVADFNTTLVRQVFDVPERQW